MKKLLFFLFVISFALISCEDENKEHTIDYASQWSQTIDNTTYTFRLSWKGGYKGKEKEHLKDLLEYVRGNYSYCSYPQNDDPFNYLWLSSTYTREKNDITFFAGGEDGYTVWLQGYIDGNIMYLSNETLNFELKKDFEKISF